MFFRTPRFIRRWIRRRMHPMAEEKALSKKQKLSYLYIFFAWNAFAAVIYQLSKGNKYWSVTHGLVTKEEMEMELKRPAYAWAKTLGIQKAEVYRVGNPLKGVTQLQDINLEETEEGINMITEEKSAEPQP
ncbi:hypothetical protein Ocin01_08827 [Orchesella cincta]|uniref:Uncharacterized protein n=1 Tax=Orchesella cincta TaxID=48709 RepID=A0A1D2MXU5_ORCCI|nr:hypothetical protein Ocin01_08827 [Orchesella cincta]